LELSFNLDVSSQLQKEVKVRINSSSGPEELVSLFHKKYPNEGKVIERIRTEALPLAKVNSYKRCYNLYKKGGSLEYAAKKTGITRERVRQILVKGTEYNLFEYNPRRLPEIGEKKIIKDIVELLSVSKVAKENNMSVSMLKRMLSKYKISTDKINELIAKGRKKKIIDLYLSVKKQLGHHPTTSELQANKHWHYLSTRIGYFWGSIHNFRAELDITQPPQFVEATRPWLEHRKKLARIKKMQDLDKICETLVENGPLQMGEIVSYCRINRVRASNLIKSLMATGEIMKNGMGRNTWYAMPNHRR
ncbi:MAG: hypothetical protein KKC50_08010, partial [Candidatus Omnitrophica bacterium]|nr:hypothetical protein [Candidatus Omnitrophota bacterium]